MQAPGRRHVVRVDVGIQRGQQMQAQFLQQRQVARRLLVDRVDQQRLAAVTQQIGVGGGCWIEKLTKNHDGGILKYQTTLSLVCLPGPAQVALAQLRSKKRVAHDPPPAYAGASLSLQQKEKSMHQLTGKVAIVTGASSGIGYETARLFAREGAKVVVTARRQAELNALVADIERDGGEAVAVAGDIRDEQLARALVETAVGRFGGLDIAFNNAGMTGDAAPVSDISIDAWQAIVDTNLTSAFLGAKYQLPAMIKRGGGSLIFTSTVVGNTIGFPGMSAYAASKAGLIGLMQVIAVEYGGYGIRANALLPGGTDTPMGRATANTPEARAFVEGLHALKRLALPEEIARSALYLASDASSFTTGSTLRVDGGASVNRT